MKRNIDMKLSKNAIRREPKIPTCEFSHRKNKETQYLQVLTVPPDSERSKNDYVTVSFMVDLVK